MSASRYLAALFAECTSGLVECRALPSGQRAWTTPGDWEALRSFVTTQVRAGQNVTVGIATRADRSSGRADNLHELPALWADLDAVWAEVRRRLESFPFRPGLLVLSGLQHVHAYFPLKEPLDLRESANRTRAASVLARLALRLGGDRQATDPARVLRLPGSRNYKYTPPPLVTLLEVSPTQVNFSEFEDLLPRAVPRRAPVLYEFGCIEQGRRNTTLFGIMRSLRSRGVAPGPIVQLVEAVNRTQCEPPLERPELRRLLGHALAQLNRADFSSVPPHAFQGGSMSANFDARKFLQSRPPGSSAPSLFLRKQEFVNGPQRFTIQAVEQGEGFPSGNGRPPQRELQLLFSDRRRMSLRPEANVLFMIATFGEQTEHWVGQEVEVYLDLDVRNPSGGAPGGLRLREPSDG